MPELYERFLSSNSVKSLARFSLSKCFNTFFLDGLPSPSLPDELSEENEEEDVCRCFRFFLRRRSEALDDEEVDEDDEDEDEDDAVGPNDGILYLALMSLACLFKSFCFADDAFLYC